MLVRTSTFDFSYARVMLPTSVRKSIGDCHRTRYTESLTSIATIIYNREIPFDIKLLLDTSLICAEDVSAFKSCRGNTCDTSRTYLIEPVHAQYVRSWGAFEFRHFTKSLYREKKLRTRKIIVY